MPDDVSHKLKERIKELTALHKTARILQNQDKSAEETIDEIIRLLPPAWQYPEVTVARIRFDDLEFATPGFRETEWRQGALFSIKGGQKGIIEICYLEPRPASDEGPFLIEERNLIESLAEMISFYFQRLQSDKELNAAMDNLEEQVRARTIELRETNTALQKQIEEYKNAQFRIETYQNQLQQLALELSLAEARERHAIASDLHDHIGQALAFIKMNISQFRGNAIFCGFETNIDNIMHLLDQTIQYTRNLTFEISPPVLYELGLGAALEWLAEKMQNKSGLNITVKNARHIGKLNDDIQIILFKATQELLTNVVKHSGASQVTITPHLYDNLFSLEINDNGRGFDAAALDTNPSRNERFGLFSIKERMRYLGGLLEIDSGPGRGARISLIVPIHKEN
jgi:signal transduction histidine kinase